MPKPIPLSFVILLVVLAGLFAAVIEEARYRFAKPPPISSEVADLPVVPAVVYYYGRYYGEIVTDVYLRAKKLTCPVPPASHLSPLLLLLARFVLDVWVAYTVKTTCRETVFPAIRDAFHSLLATTTSVLHFMAAALNGTRRLLGLPLCH